MRRNVQLVGLRQQRNIAGTRETLPRNVDHHDIHRARLEIRPVIPNRRQVLTRSYRATRTVLNLAQPVGLIHVNLHPHHVELLQHSTNLNRGLWLNVEVQIQRNLNIRANSLLERPDVLLRMSEQCRRDFLIGRTAAETRAVTKVATIQRHYVRLQCTETAVPHLVTQISNRLQGIQRRNTYQLMVTRTR